MISLRPIAPQDDEFLYRVYASTRQEELAQVNWDAAQKEAFLRMQFEAQAKYYSENYIGAQFQIVLLDDTPVGRLYVARWAKEIRIMDIALLPEYRGRGIGSVLLKDILAEGQAHGVSVTIHVERLNPARHLYDRLGFRLAEDKGIYYLLEWTPRVG